VPFGGFLFLQVTGNSSEARKASTRLLVKSRSISEVRFGKPTEKWRAINCAIALIQSNAGNYVALRYKENEGKLPPVSVLPSMLQELIFSY